MSLLSFDGFSLDIHSVPILHDIDVTIGAGEIVALTGESGSGKSMTALSAMQLLPKGARQSGRVMLGETDLTAQSEPALCKLRGNDIGMIFQEPMTALNPVHSIGAQVTEAIRLHAPDLPRREVEARSQATLTRVGLPPDAFPPGRFPHELSGGQRQRVVIAIAIALQPRLLIADEPTTALDVTTQAQILALLQKLTREDGMGLMMITHDLAVVADLADRVCVMQKGRIVEQGPTASLLRNRSHAYTRALFAASSHRVDLPDPPPPEPLLKVDGVIRDYALPRRTLFAKRGYFRAVDDVSFKIDRGERLGLVGESGCGKSTLTRAILGLEPVQGGSITLSGAPVFAGTKPNLAVRRDMQVVFQDPFGSFNPRHRVGQLITEPFHLLDTPPQGAERREAVAEALSSVGLSPDDANRYIHEFSGGQRQRIAIARALIIKPALILFDEAVSALDVSVRAQILDLLADLCRSHGLTYLFISHDLSVVRSVTDRVLVMHKGRIVEEGPTQAVFDAPQQPYTRKLIAAAPVLPQFEGAA